MLSFLPRSIGSKLLSGLVLLLAPVFAYSSTVAVNPTITNSGGLYNYAYSISYTGPDDLFLVDISVAADPSAVTNIMTPTGFKSQFDSVNGIVSFLEDTSYFTSTPTSGFSFESSIAPVAASFTGSVLDSSFNISSIVGTTLAPTPEPAYFYLLAFMTPIILMWKRRKSVGCSCQTDGSKQGEW